MKEVWEITLDEFRNDILKGYRDFNLLGSRGRKASDLALALKAAPENSYNFAETTREFERVTEEEHMVDVLLAFSDGKPVSREILHTYASHIKNTQ